MSDVSMSATDIEVAAAPKRTKTSPKLAVGYAFGEVGCQMSWYMINNYLTLFYTDIVGSSPLLDTLRREGVPVALKAVVTEQNKGWSAAALCRELRREHEAIRAQRTAARNHPHKAKR